MSADARRDRARACLLAAWAGTARHFDELTLADLIDAAHDLPWRLEELAKEMKP